MAAGSALIRVRRREGKAHLLPQDSAMHKQDAYLSSRCNVQEMHTTSGDDRLASCKILQDPACKAGSSLDRSRSMRTAPLPSYSGWLCIIHRCTSLKMKSGMYRRYPADAATFTGPHFFQTSGMSCRLDDLPLAGFILVHHPQGRHPRASCELMPLASSIDAMSGDLGASSNEPGSRDTKRSRKAPCNFPMDLRRLPPGCTT
jgi:hypothetical protein